MVILRRIWQTLLALLREAINSLVNVIKMNKSDGRRGANHYDSHFILIIGCNLS